VFSDTSRAALRTRYAGRKIRPAKRRQIEFLLEREIVRPHDHGAVARQPRLNLPHAVRHHETTAHQLPAGLGSRGLRTPGPAHHLLVVVPRRDAEVRAAGALHFQPRLQCKDITRHHREALRGIETPVFLAGVFDARRGLPGMDVLVLNRDAPGSGARA